MKLGVYSETDNFRMKLQVCIIGSRFYVKETPYSKEPVFRIMVGRNQKIQYLNCSTLDVLQSFLIWLNILTSSLTVEDDFCIVLLSRNPIINPPPLCALNEPMV